MDTKSLISSHLIGLLLIAIGIVLITSDYPAFEPWIKTIVAMLGGATLGLAVILSYWFGVMSRG